MAQCNFEAETRTLGEEEVYFCVEELGHEGRHTFTATVPLKKPHPRYGYRKARQEKSNG